VTVGEFATDARLGVKLTLIAGSAGTNRPLRHPRVQKSGLALAGHYYGVVPTRVQVFGETELSYLDSITPDARSLSCRGFFALGLSCVVLTRDNTPQKALAAAAEATSTPLYVSDTRSSKTINAIHATLDERLAPSTQLHGVLVDVFGVGLLLLGKSGIGKSECAVELVLRGHRLVADDVVKCDWRPPGMVFGAPADLLRHHVEVRGLGILNLKEMFGVTAVRERKRIDVVVKLEEWNDASEYDRLGITDQFQTILGQPIRMLTVPVRPARDMGSILEMAARNELLRRAGKNPAKDFVSRVEGARAAELASIADAPESVAGPVAILSEGDVLVPPPNSSVARAEPPRLTESSAWIPAVRPRTDGDS
jgi:HPr kinase/phosphorylase